VTQPLFKYIGNKYRSAARIVDRFPKSNGTYFEPFFGSGAVLGELRPKRAVVSDICAPLISLWQLAKFDPESLVVSYTAHWKAYLVDRQLAYDKAKESFNENPNAHDFLFISRACYGGVIRFRRDGYLSTPLGAHTIISPTAFSLRLRKWHEIIRNTEFICGDFSEVTSLAQAGDIIYCDPPYVDTQKILYGAQDFSLGRMYAELRKAKNHGAFIALSIDGMKRSGRKHISIEPPSDLFEVEAYLSLGGSMLKRFSRGGSDVLDEHVRDRLLLSNDLGLLKEDPSGVQLKLQAID
jgi:DNA adenine methylase